ncbi:hypothetical protein J1N35_004821 [Gossypium stocksii]|uniref:BED-type domain-containing protein n=1 Tax=Gossypium stocksii TaxID=47602 RepID=A0A9D3WCP9_9ROSI|nr:hypothetical protein J1N35_004821 [Gossypium stocksii]
MVVIKGNEISNAQDTTHKRPTPEKAECLDDIEVATYTRRNRKKTSIVWQELTIVKLADRTKKVQCNHCKIKLAKNKDGTTTQYKRHLNGFVKCQASLKGQDSLFLPPQALRSNSASGIQTWKSGQEKIREVVSHMIMVYELPFAFTEYELFTLLMKTTSPHYVRISRAITKADCWTSYEIGICKKRVLNFVDVPPLHSGVVVYDALYKCLKDCDIEGKVCSISMDYASYNDVTVKLLKDSLSFHKRLSLNGKLFHVCCCAHILNLLVHDGLFEIEDVIDNVRESVKHITTSTVHLAMFNDIVKQLQLPNKSFYVIYFEKEAIRQICIVRNSLYELYKEYMDEYVATNVGTSMEKDVQESGVNNVSTASRIGKGKVMTGRQMLLCGSDWYQKLYG